MKVRVRVRAEGDLIWTDLVVQAHRDGHRSESDADGGGEERIRRDRADVRVEVALGCKHREDGRVGDW